MESISPYSYYNENIFGLEDLYLYWAVYHLYAGNFDKAIQDFDTSVIIKKQIKLENENSDSDSDSNQTDLSDVGLCSLNLNEHVFNKCLCYLL